MEDQEENEKTKKYENENTENSEEIREAMEQLLEKVENASEILQKNNEEAEAIKKRLNELWKDPFGLLELFLILSTEAGAKFNRENRPIASEQNDYVFEALTRLHAKACLIGQEIITLMRNGYAAGAFARWRSLHEIAVVSLFINKYGNSTAERYLCYDIIESYRALREYIYHPDIYKKHSEVLGYAPYPYDEIKNIEKLRNQLCNQFDNIDKSFGWAAEDLGDKSPNFHKIEKDVGLDYLRPFYNMSNHFIHAGPKGTVFNMGLSEKVEGHILLTGPSNFGMADPGSCMAISLNQVNRALLSTKPNVQTLVFMETIKYLVDEINKQLIEIHESFDDNKINSFNDKF
jgi:hypothetical protein